MSFSFAIKTLLVAPFIVLCADNVCSTSCGRPLFKVLLLVSRTLCVIGCPRLGLSCSTGGFGRVAGPTFIRTLVGVIMSITLIKGLKLINVTVNAALTVVCQVNFRMCFADAVIGGHPRGVFCGGLTLFTDMSIFNIFLYRGVFPVSSCAVGR